VASIGYPVAKASEENCTQRRFSRREDMLTADLPVPAAGALAAVMHEPEICFSTTPLASILHGDTHALINSFFFPVKAWRCW